MPIKNSTHTDTTPTRTLALLVGLLCAPATQAWERDDRFGNVPFFRGQPMLAQKRAMLFAPAAQLEVRLAGQGWLGTSLRPDALEERAAALMQAWHGPIPRYGGVRDERYFLISLEPDVVVITPFTFDLKYRSGAQLRGGREDISSGVLNPMYRQLQAQQRSGTGQGLAEGLKVQLPNPNYVELGCAFPEMEGAMLWAPAFMDRPIAFDADARSRLNTKLGLDVRKHPRVGGYWQVDGCPT
jgi:hypothetical protein